MKFNHEFYGKLETDEFFTNDDLKKVILALLRSTPCYEVRNFNKFLMENKNFSIEIQIKGG